MAGIMRKIILTASAPKPLGPYSYEFISQAVLVDNTMYISGQLGLDPETMKMVDGGVEAEAKQAMNNIKAILNEGGGDMNNLVKTTILLADIKEWPAVNKVYETFFTGSFPARAAYQAGALPAGGRVEIEAVAVMGQITDA